LNKSSGISIASRAPARPGRLERFALVWVLGASLSMGLLVVAALLLDRVFPHPPPPPEEMVRLGEQFISGTYFLHPEPQERFLFVSLLLACLPVCTLAVKLAGIISHVVPFNRWRLLHFGASSFFFAASLVFTLGLGLIEYYAWWPTNPSAFPATALAYLIVAALLQAWWFRKSCVIHAPTGRTLKKWTLLLITSFVWLQCLAYRVVDVGSITWNWAWYSHFAAVFHSVSQVLGGKTVLTDFPAQYGLYAELISPLLRLFPHKVLAFTSLMALFQFIGLASLIALLFSRTRHTLLALLASLTLCNIPSWFTDKFFWEPYYQYWPIRFIFPALAIRAFVLLLRTPRFSSFLLYGIFSGLAILWNMDSGIPVLGALVAFLVLRLVWPHAGFSRSRALAGLAAGGAGLGGTLILVWMGLSWKSGGLLHLEWATKYQSIFFISGFYALPMPLVHSWELVILCYLLAITGCLVASQQGWRSEFLDLIFFVAILGLGLFSYYQGRSHDWVLTGVAWPAVIIACLCLDRTLRAVRLGRIPKNYLSMILIPLFFFVAASFSIVQSRRNLLRTGIEHAQPLLFPQACPVADNIEFIRAHTHPGESVYLLSRLAPVYYAEAGLVSAVPGPGLGELILKSDETDLCTAIQQHPPELLFLDETVEKLNPTLAAHYPEILRPYALESESASLMRCYRLKKP
jgi:hypothetical protein